MRTVEGCDGKCATCNMTQQAYCGLCRLVNEKTDALAVRLEKVEKALASEMPIAQGGGGVEKTTIINNSKLL